MNACYFDNFDISKYRNPLMGIAAILIILVHATVNIDNLTPLCVKLLEQGNYGVDIFFFLSGVGLSFSLNKQEVNGLFKSVFSKDCINWLLARYKKILIPFGLITLLFATYSILFEGKSIAYALLHLSTLAYWVTGIGAWFISTLVILYLLAPLLYKILFRKTSGLGIAYLICFFIMVICQYEDKEGILRNILQGFVRVPAFILGIAYAPYVLNKSKVNIFFIICFAVVGACVCMLLKFTFPMMYSKWILVQPVVILFIFALKRCNIIKRIAEFMGKISLESYLYNIYMTTILLHKSWVLLGLDLSYNHYVEYLVVVVGGTFLSYYTSQFIANKFK